MRSFVIIFLFVSLSLAGYAQAPQKFSFQGVAKDAAGKAVANKTISLRLMILGNPGGTQLYVETHNTVTTSSGVFTISIGAGEVQSGSMQNVDWKNHSHSLWVEIDPSGGTNYAHVGTADLLSVPYALHSDEAGRWKNDDPVVQTGILGQGSSLSSNNQAVKLIWYPRKAAFRAGGANDNQWEDANIGEASSAFGFSTKASGQMSMAIGSGTSATGFASLAMGNNTTATNSHSVAMGEESDAVGENAVAMGFHAKAAGYSSLAVGLRTTASGPSSLSAGQGTIAKSPAASSFGSYNNNQDTPLPNGQNSQTDRIFQIGNGSDDQNTSNAITVLRNGYTGIGNNALDPAYILDIGGRARIKRNPGFPAALVFDDSNNNPNGMVGMKNDTEIGFFHTGKWSFWVDGQGSAHVVSGILQTSDKRLKTNIAPLSNSLAKLTELNGYRYVWKDSTLDQSIQTGVIAQEIEALFPDLVKTDEKGFKSVNYNGLIPHLIESVKELNASLNALQSDKSKLKAENEGLKAQTSQITAMQQEMSQLRNSLNSIEASLKLIPNNAAAKTPSEK